ncbi:MAG: FeoA family protein [Gemmatimonadota bacterium]
MNDDDLRLAHVPMRETVELVRMELSEEMARPLMERGVLPGCRMCPLRTSPSGDPVVLVDGTVLALRRDLARCLCVKSVAGAA